MNHEILARGVCVQDDKILLAYFKPKEYYFLPGGHVEHGESVLNALEREIMEEISITAKAQDVALIFEHTWQNKEKLIHEINFIITYTIPKDSKIISAIDHLDFRWVSIEDLKTIKFLPSELTMDIIEISSGYKFTKFKSSIKK